MLKFRGKENGVIHNFFPTKANDITEVKWLQLKKTNKQKTAIQFAER